MMKAAGSGLLILLAGGAGVLGLDGELTFERQLLLCLMAGTLGTFVCYAISGSHSLRDMSRQLLGNVFLAIGAGPFLSVYIAAKAGTPLSPQLLFIVGLAVGIGGVYILKKLWPIAANAIAKALPMVIGAYLRQTVPTAKRQPKRRKPVAPRIHEPSNATEPVVPPQESPPLT